MPQDRTVAVKLKGDVSDFNRALIGASATAKAFTKELDTSTDRATNFTQSLLAIGPALVPVGAASIPIITGLTNQLAFATLGAGTAALAFSGVGDALKATNDYAIEPTDANLQKMQQSLAELGPAGREFVGFLQELRPQLQQLQDLAQQGLLPGAEQGIREVMELLPQAERLVSTVATTLGDLFAEAGDNLNDPRWREFFTFLENEARPTLLDMGRTLGNFAEGFANLWMAFDPLSDNFSASFLQLSRDFAKWTDGLAETEGFQEFVDYIQTNGPRAWETLGAIGNALLQIVEAAAPVGAVALPVIKAVANSIASVADSDLGPVIIGVVSLTSAYSRLIAVSQSANSSALGNLFGKSAYAGTLTAARQLPGALLAVESASERANTKAGALSATSQRLGTSLRGTAKLAGGAAGLAFVMSDLDDKMGLSNTATLGLAGSVAGPWGAAVLGGIGLAMDFAAANDDVGDAVKRANEALSQGPSNLEQQSAAVDEARQKVEELKDSIETYSTNPFSGDFWKGAKNFWEGAFGSSDIEESKTALQALEDQLAKNARAAEDQKFAEAGLGDSMASAGDQAREETLALIANRNAKNDAADAAENAFSAETNLRQAMKDAKKQADSNNAGIDGNSDAALKNRRTIEQLTDAWNTAADAGDKTTGDLKKFRKELLQTAIDMGVPQEELKELAALLHLPSPKPTVTVQGIDKAYTQIAKLKEYLRGIKDEDVIVHVRQAIESGGGRGHQTKADGGYISGPGGPREDKIPAMLSNGEFVVNAAATSRNLGLLHEINSRRYAGGGFVQPTGAVAPVTASIDRSGATVQIDVHPSEGQSEYALAEQLSNQVLWRLSR